MKFDPSAEVQHDTGKIPVNFPAGNRKQEINLPPGTTGGSVNMWIVASWFRNMWDGNMTGYGQAWLDAPFKVNADNKLDWTLPRPAVSNIGYGAMLVSPVPCTAAGNTVMISPTINSMGTIGTSMGTSGGVTVPGASAGATSGVTKGAVAGGIESRTYIVKVNVAPIPVESRTFTAYFDINSSKVEEASEISLASWYMSQLPVSMRKSIEDGVTTVWIRGHASTTNTIEYNRILSLNRAKKIENIL